MKALAIDIVAVDGDSTVERGLLPKACLDCGADVVFERTAPLGISVPIRCGECGFELELRRLEDDRAAIRRPYGCRRFVDVTSSNLAAVGVHGTFLVVRFKRGGVYRYEKAADLFSEMIGSTSVGKFFHHRVKSAFAGDRLCATYGCFEPANRVGRVLCRLCLDPHPG